MPTEHDDNGRPFRAYEGFWIELKRTKKVALKLKNSAITADRKVELNRLKKAFIKEKHRDTNFKRFHPNARLSFKLLESKGILIVTLENYFAIVKPEDY